MEEDMPVGAIIEQNGIRKRHLGGGRFEPVGEPMEKRHDMTEGEPLHKVATDEATEPR